MKLNDTQLNIELVCDRLWNIDPADVWVLTWSVVWVLDCVSACAACCVGIIVTTAPTNIIAPIIANNVGFIDCIYRANINKRYFKLVLIFELYLNG